MGLFFSSKKPTVSQNSSMQSKDNSTHRVSNQYGSRKGEINHAEVRHGIDHELHQRFYRDTERKTIETMINRALDKSRGANRYVIDKSEVEEIVKDVHKIYPEHSKTVQEILEARL